MCLYVPLNRAYLNILTLFFYKCVWSRQTQITGYSPFLYGGGIVNCHEPGMAKTAITTLRYRILELPFYVGTAISATVRLVT